jgi:glycosyltransferase involved in cell wall biosynthesis
MLTVVIISFHSSKLIEERIKEIENNIPIIIIENSRNFSLKEQIEKNHRNVKIIIPSENLGWGKAVNIGIKESKTQMVFIIQPDVKLIDNCINKLIECVKEFNDFTLLTPRDIAKKNFVNYEVYKKYPQVGGDNLFLLKQVDYTDITWLINKEKFDNKDLWDENMENFLHLKKVLTQLLKY